MPRNSLASGVILYQIINFSACVCMWRGVAWRIVLVRTLLTVLVRMGKKKEKKKQTWKSECQGKVLYNENFDS
jgi:hypothetical protein